MAVLCQRRAPATLKALCLKNIQFYEMLSCMYKSKSHQKNVQSLGLKLCPFDRWENCGYKFSLCPQDLEYFYQIQYMKRFTEKDTLGRDLENQIRWFHLQRIPFPAACQREKQLHVLIQGVLQPSMNSVQARSPVTGKRPSGRKPPLRAPGSGLLLWVLQIQKARRPSAGWNQDLAAGPVPEWLLTF